jgi:hypothetical protein
MEYPKHNKEALMFETERVAASAQLSRRIVTFKKCHGYVCPDKLQDRHTLVLAGVKKYTGNAAWFDAFVDSEEFKQHFDTHTLIDHDDICPVGTPTPSPLLERAWASFTR